VYCWKRTNALNRRIQYYNYQDCFSYNNTFLQQTGGLAMGCLLCAELLEIFVIYIKWNCTVQTGGKYKLLVFMWYVDDIMIIYDHNIPGFFSGGTRTAKNFVNLTGESKNFKCRNSR
jgi:hypothetical protein